MFNFKNIMSTIRPELFLVFILSVFFSTAHSEIYQEYAVRASLTANLAIFTTWPLNAPDRDNHISLCLVGNQAIEEAFANLNGKKIGEKNLQVRYLSRFNALEECQILYISELDKNKLLLLLNEIQSLPILTIGEDAYFTENGGMVSLQIIDGKVSITVNLKASKKANLAISARVLKLATVIQ